MIENLPWYFWVIAALTLTNFFADAVKIASIAAGEKGITLWVLPEVVGLLWCVHALMVAAS